MLIHYSDSESDGTVRMLLDYICPARADRMLLLSSVL